MADPRTGDRPGRSRDRQPAKGTPTATFARPTFAPEELAVRKTLALYGRAEPRDFIDVYVLHRRFGREATLRCAAEADRGFDFKLFAQMLRSHARIDDVDFPDVGIPIADVRAYFDAWRKASAEAGDRSSHATIRPEPGWIAMSLNAGRNPQPSR